jgi:hypothetical protein
VLRKLPATVVAAGYQYQELTRYNTTGLISPRQITAKLVRNIKPSKRCMANNMSIRAMVITLLIRLRTGETPDQPMGKCHAMFEIY